VPEGEGGLHSCLVLKASGLFVALPVESAMETMRPLPIDALAGMPPYVLGLSRIRGQAVPVVHLAVLLGATSSAPVERFVTVDAGGRRVALAADAVVGIRELGAAALGELPPLLGTVQADLVEALGVLDEGLLVVLRAARILPPDVWKRVQAATAQAQA